MGIKKGEAQATFKATQIKTLDFPDLKNYVANNNYPVQQSALEDSGWTLVDEKTRTLLDKLRTKGVPLGESVNGKIYRGVLTGLNEAFVIDAETRERLIAEDAKSKELIKPFLLGKDIKRYQPLEGKRYLILMPKGWTRLNSNGANWRWLENHYPSIAAHLKPFSEKAQKRCDKGEYWWELRACDYYGEFEKPKIILPDISLRGNFAFDDEGQFYCVNTAYIIASADKYLLGILNSRLITFYYANLSASYRGGYLRFIYQYLVQLPICIIDKANPDKIVQLVEQMLELNKQLAAATEPQLKKLLKQQIERVDGEIDQLFYRLYDLTGEEIGIVEKSQG